MSTDPKTNEKDEATAVSDSVVRANSEMGVRPGDVIAEKYEITSVIGKGGMGMVVAAQHLQLKETVALKFLLSATENDKEFRARFLREAQVSAKLRGEHVARVMDFGAPQGKPPYIVMEHLSGVDVRQVLNEHGKLPLDLAIDYVTQAAEGVAEAHAKGVVHRDLKPSNLFVTKRLDGSDLVKILDFGVSKLHAQTDVDEDLTSAGTLLGSPRYMSPEQLQNSMDVDAGTDIWALGAILYEMLAGRPPFQSGPGGTAALIARILGTEPPPSFASLGVTTVPPAVEAAIFRCLERDRAKRTPDVGSFVQELADAIDTPWLRQAAGRIHGILQHRSRGDAATGAVSVVSQRITASRATAPSSPGSSPGVATSGGAPGASRRGTLVISGVVVVAAALAVVWFSRREPPREPTVAAAPPSAAAPARSAEPTPASAAPPVSTTPAVSSAPPVASAPPDDKKGTGKRAGGAAVTGKPTAPPPTAPPPTAPPPPPKTNPLGDRF